MRYALRESLDGSLDLNEGHVSVTATGPHSTTVEIDKALRVANNRLLFTMLRANPRGLEWMLRSWIRRAGSRARASLSDGSR